MHARAAAVASLCLVVTLAVGCNRRVFRLVEESCDSTIPVDLTIPTQRAADILIVVDNSGSMQEEQDRLAANFFNLHAAVDPSAPDVAGGECPLDKLTAIPPQYKNPAPELYAPGGPLSACGFIQILAAFDNDFRVGVITTDMGLVDNRLGAAPAGWGFHPQRGCLQPDGAPGDQGLHRLIARKDLEDDDTNNDALAERFSATLANIRVFGSPYERGLDAMTTFLDPAASRGEGCDGDLETFRRPDAQLVVIFLSDEEDCSHALGTAPFDELADEPAPGVWQDLFTHPGPDHCYSEEGALPSTTGYAEALKRIDPHAKVAVIGGLVPNTESADGFTAGGCLAGDVPSGECYPSHGASNSVGANDVCGGDPSNLRHGIPCCVADSGARYLDFARQFQADNTRDFRVDSICNDAFSDTLLEIAAFIASTTFVDLVEPPKDGVVTVDITPAGSHTALPVEEIERARCNDTAGWYLEGDRRIVFCGSAIPGPGDALAIRAKGQAASPSCVEGP